MAIEYSYAFLNKVENVPPQCNSNMMLFRYIWHNLFFAAAAAAATTA